MFFWSSRRSPHQRFRVRRFVSSFLRRHLMLTSLFVYFFSSFDNRIFIKTKSPYLQFRFFYLCYIRPILYPNTSDLIQLFLLFLFLRGFNYLSFVKIFLRYLFFDDVRERRIEFRRYIVHGRYKTQRNISTARDWRAQWPVFTTYTRTPMSQITSHARYLQANNTRAVPILETVTLHEGRASVLNAVLITWFAIVIPIEFYCDLYFRLAASPKNCTGLVTDKVYEYIYICLPFTTIFEKYVALLDYNFCFINWLSLFPLIFEI